MKNTWLWIIGIGTILIIGLAFLLGVGILRLQTMPMNWLTGGRDVWRYSGWHHHDLRWGAPMMGLFGGLLMWLFLFGLVVLVGAGVFLLVRALQQPNRDRFDYTQKLCDHCGKKVASDWLVCPYCGESLRSK